MLSLSPLELSQEVPGPLRVLRPSISELVEGMTGKGAERKKGRRVSGSKEKIARKE